jgi:hypothetical protein
MAAKVKSWVSSAFYLPRRVAISIGFRSAFSTVRSNAARLVVIDEGAVRLKFEQHYICHSEAGFSSLSWVQRLSVQTGGVTVKGEGRREECTGIQAVPPWRADVCTGQMFFRRFEADEAVFGRRLCGGNCCD